MSESIKLYTDNSAIIDTNVQLGHWHKIVSFHLLKLTEITARTLQKLDSDSTFREFFEVDRLVAWIRDNAFLRTALQLPDGLLKYAYRMSTTLEAECSNVKIYILADTSYRSCCIDDVAAQHAQCDSLVHFGEACLSQSSERIPVLYVFGRHTLDIDEFRARLNEYVSTNELAGRSICLLYDAIFSHCSEQIKNELVAALPSTSRFSTCDILQHDAHTSKQNAILGRVPPPQLQENDEQILFFVGVESSQLLPIWLMTFTQFTEFVHFAPEINLLTSGRSAAHRQLRRRMFLVERLKDANVVGLVVGTLEIRGYRDAVERVRRLCKTAAKKLYVFSIGKLNEAKLSNFAADIDAFILLSCPFGVVLDAGDFYKPLVTLFEAEIALNSDKQWFAGAGWTAEFGAFLNDDIGARNADEGDVSLVTGRIRAARAENHEAAEGVGVDSAKKQLMQYTAGIQSADSSYFGLNDHTMFAGDYFAQRTWKGLDDGYSGDGDGVDRGDATDLRLKDGLSGLSLSYITTKKSEDA